jgi:predicted methyltransferase
MIPRLPVGELGSLVVLNFYHEMPKYEEVFRHFREALKPGGCLVIAETSPSPGEESRAQQSY